MEIFRRLFGRKESKTDLQNFLDKLTPERAKKTYKSVSDHHVRLPAAISSMALYTTQKFVAGYSEMSRDASKYAGAAAPVIPYDAVAFEAAAYIHYWLMRDLLEPDFDDYNVEIERGEEPYLTCLKQAAIVSDLIIQRHTTFSLPKKFFMNRLFSYSANRNCHEAFISALLSAQAHAAPGPIRQPEATELPIQLAAISYVGVFNNSYLEALPKSVENLYAADKAGLL